MKKTQFYKVIIRDRFFKNGARIIEGGVDITLAKHIAKQNRENGFIVEIIPEKKIEKI